MSESGRTGAECPDKTVRLTRDVNAIIAALKALPKNHGTMNDIGKSAGLNSDRFKPAIAAALKAGRVISVKVVKGNGQTYDAYELCHSDSPGQSI